MFTKKTAIALGLALLAGGGTAWAGYKQSYGVVIHPAPINAFGGDMGAARNSADTIQYIHVTYFASTTGLIFADLAVRDASGASATCRTYDAGLIEVLHSLTSDSSIMVYHDGAGTCNSVLVNTSSYNMPK
ncbi:hypothetical protein DRW03_35070 [Corallococcus sp. H22C18031201]|uniref:hypothetical protein n=1 Tax=Citreicoccus inhibens TaxID=2849499 RepID=UPI000E77117E|nr:hypothetical protein [Citreicoccus inhibens]MBU8900356.1 hypothetical protein [Citreicoccus inhibens]RJS14327.1 hypothetical protein DRW03_35070 [Corallococcus sp. H22C18031201]